MRTISIIASPPPNLDFTLENVIAAFGGAIFAVFVDMLVSIGLSGEAVTITVSSLISLGGIRP